MVSDRYDRGFEKLKEIDGEAGWGTSSFGIVQKIADIIHTNIIMHIFGIAILRN